MSRWTSRQLAIATAIAFVLGWVAGGTGLFRGRAVGSAYDTAKREFRLFLGLPKFWVKGFVDDTASSIAVDCPQNALVFATGGQSNAANAISSPVDADPSKPVFTFFDGRCYLARDPVLGATGHRGSLWTVFGQRLVDAVERPVVFIHGAVGGSQVGDWLDDRSGYRQRLSRRIARARSQGLVVDYVLWHQGETDAKVGLGRDEYRNEMSRLIDVIDAEAGLAEDATWLLFQASICVGEDRSTSNPEILGAQADVVDARDDVLLAVNTDRWGSRYRRDGCHFNGHGRDEIVKALLEVVVPLVAASDGADGDGAAGAARLH